MNSNRKTSVIVGVLFIAALVSTTLSGVFSGSIEDPNYLPDASASGNKVLIGVLFQLTLTASVVAIPIMMYPILKGHSENLALGYIVARIFEAFFDVVIAISMLLLLTLSREYVEAGAPEATYFQTTGTVLQALKDWASVPENFPYGLGALILNFALFQSRLVPRWISVWGLVGGVLMLAMGFFRMFDHPVFFLAIPIILNEMVLAVWLIVKGFNPSAIASESVKTDKNEA